MQDTGGPGGAQPANSHSVPRGRPRIHNDEVILDAALELLMEVGYQRISMHAIAARSGVSVPSIYRRWANKTEVVSAAVARSRRVQLDPTGDLRTDLVAQLRDVRLMYEAVSHIGLTGTLLAEERHHPELIAAWRKTVTGPRRQGIEAIIERAKHSGAVDIGTDAVVAGQMLIGAFYAARIAGNTLAEGWDENVVDALIAGIGSKRPLVRMPDHDAGPNNK